MNDRQTTAKISRNPVHKHLAFSRVLSHTRRLVVGHPQWVYWAALCLAFAVLYQRLGAAGPTLNFWFDSDYLFEADFYKDIFVDHFPITGVKFSIAPSLFPGLFFTSCFMFLTRNAILATFLLGLLQFTLLVAAYVFCVAVVLEERRQTACTCIFLVAIGLVLHTSSILNRMYDTLYYLFLESHLSSFAMVLFCAGLSVWLCFHPWRSVRALIAVGALVGLSILGTISDLTFLATMLPFTVAVGIARYLELLPPRRPWLVLIVGWGSDLLGIMLGRAFFDSAGLGTQTGISIDRFTTALNTYLKGMYVNCLHGDWLHLVALIWISSVMIVILYLVRRHIVLQRQFGEMSLLARRLVLMVLFLALASIGCVVSILVMGISGLSELKDYGYSMHYQHPLFFGGIFGLALLADVALSVRFGGFLPRFQWVPCAVAVVVPLCVLMTSSAPATPLYAYTPPLVRALDALAPQYGLRYGVGGFWQTRWVNLFSKAGLRLYPISGSLEPFFWLSNKYWYDGYPTSRYPHPVYNFIVLDDPLWKIPRELVVARFGPPAAEVMASGVRVLIYNRPSDERFRDFFSCSVTLAALLHPLDHASDRLEVPGACLPGLVGTIEGSGRVAREGKTPPGFLSYGPYLALKPGTYSATMGYKATGPAGQRDGDWDLVFGLDPVAVVSGAVRAGQAEIRARVAVSSVRAGQPIQMRVIYKGTGDVRVEKLIIERIQ